MPLPDENRVESMRASRSSSQCRKRSFHCGGMIWRTGTLGQFESAEAPGRVRLRCLARMLRQTQGAFALPGESLISNRAGKINQWSCYDFEWRVQCRRQPLDGHEWPL